MRILDRYTTEHISDVKDSRLSDLKNFFAGNSVLSAEEKISALKDIREVIRKNSESYVIQLARETGNPAASCREEIGVSLEIVESAFSLQAAGYPVNKSELVDVENYLVTRTAVPNAKGLSITPRINPFYRFVENLVSAILNGTTLVIRVSSVGSLTVSSFWNDVSRTLKTQILPVFMESDGVNLRKLIRALEVSTARFMGSRENYLKLLSESRADSIQGCTRKRSYALIWDDSDPDISANIIAHQALVGTKDPEFAPHRVLVKKDRMEYISNRIAEEAFLLKAGDPGDPQTDISCFLTSGDLENFLLAVEDEIKNWGEPIATPVRDKNSLSPAIFRCSDSPGALWNNTEFGPFIIIRGIDSLEEAVEILNSDTRAGSILVFSNDLNVLNFVDHNTYLDYILCDPPSILKYRDIFRIENSLQESIESISGKRRKIVWK